MDLPFFTTFVSKHGGVPMLILSRKINESIIIGENVTVIVGNYSPVIGMDVILDFQ
jgi:hypothetical protein